MSNSQTVGKWSGTSIGLRLAGLLFVFSGAAGLIYEVLWMRMLGLVFGATTFATSAVLAAFMGGLALGSAWAGKKTIAWRNPLRVYGWMELAIAVYALLVPLLFNLIDAIYPTLYARWQGSYFVFSSTKFPTFEPSAITA